jgi:hypothetical protein
MMNKLLDKERNCMKRKFVLGNVVLMLIVILILGCSSNPAQTKTALNAESAKPNNESGVTVAAMKTSIRDWQGRALNEPAIPVWLGPASRGDFSQYEAAFNVQAGNGLFRLSIGEGADVRAATMRADMNYARMIAKELHQSISNFSADKARSGSMTQNTASAIEEGATTKSQAEITGHQKKTEFWQLTDAEDPLTGKTTRQVIVYQVYSIDPNAWAATTAKYIREVVGEMPANLSLEQREVNDMVTQMMYDARHPIVLSQEQAKMKLEAEKRMVDAQIDLAPAQQKAATDAELARINQEALTARTAISAEQRTAQTQALADGRVQQAAYLSGDPVLKSAASVTPADAQWVNAMNIAAGILFQ